MAPPHRERAQLRGLYTQVDSHFCKIKRRCSFLSNFSQSVLENGTIMLECVYTENRPVGQCTLRIQN